MALILFFILIVAGPIFANVIYKHNGKRQIFNIDAVQFIYGFVLGPIAFLWLKSFIFYVLRNEVNLSLTVGDLFFIDTIFSVIMVYILMAISIHSVTKSFWLKKNRDPLYDIFHLSEYFHLWFTHIMIFMGSLAVMALGSLLNLAIAFPLEASKNWLFLVLIAGLSGGFAWFFAVWNSDPKQQRRNFIKTVKLSSAAFFLFHVTIYFIVSPSFSMKYSAYWFMSAFSFAIVIAFSFFNKSSRMRSLQEKLLHSGWGKNIEIPIKFN